MFNKKIKKILSLAMAFCMVAGIITVPATPVYASGTITAPSDINVGLLDHQQEILRGVSSTTNQNIRISINNGVTYLPISDGSLSFKGNDLDVSGFAGRTLRFRIGTSTTTSTVAIPARLATPAAPAVNVTNETIATTTAMQYRLTDGNGKFYNFVKNGSNDPAENDNEITGVSASAITDDDHTSWTDAWPTMSLTALWDYNSDPLNTSNQLYVQVRNKYTTSRLSSLLREVPATNRFRQVNVPLAIEIPHLDNRGTSYSLTFSLAVGTTALTAYQVRFYDASNDVIGNTWTNIPATGLVAVPSGAAHVEYRIRGTSSVPASVATKIAFDDFGNASNTSVAGELGPIMAITEITAVSHLDVDKEVIKDIGKQNTPPILISTNNGVTYTDIKASGLTFDDDDLDVSEFAGRTLRFRIEGSTATASIAIPARGTVPNPVINYSTEILNVSNAMEWTIDPVSSASVWRTFTVNGNNDDTVTAIKLAEDILNHTDGNPLLKDTGVIKIHVRTAATSSRLASSSVELEFERKAIPPVIGSGNGEFNLVYDAKDGLIRGGATTLEVKNPYDNVWRAFSSAGTYNAMDIVTETLAKELLSVDVEVRTRATSTAFASPSTTFPINLSSQQVPDAPTGFEFIAATETLTGVNSSMEYAISIGNDDHDNNWIKFSGTTLNLASILNSMVSDGGGIHIRSAQVGGIPPSAITKITVATPTAAPTAPTIDFENELVKIPDAGSLYRFGTSGSWLTSESSHASDGISVATPSRFGSSINVRATGNLNGTTLTPNSAIITVSIPQRPATPSGVVVNTSTGKVTGLNENMEYQLSAIRTTTPGGAWNLMSTVTLNNGEATFADIDKSGSGGFVVVRTKHVPGGSFASLAFATTAQMPATKVLAPTGITINYTEEKIRGLLTTMEYRIGGSAGDPYTAVNTTVANTGVNGGLNISSIIPDAGDSSTIVYVRMRETANAVAGDDLSLEIKPRQAAPVVNDGDPDENNLIYDNTTGELSVTDPLNIGQVEYSANQTTWINAGTTPNISALLPTGNATTIYARIAAVDEVIDISTVTTPGEFRSAVVSWTIWGKQNRPTALSAKFADEVIEVTHGNSFPGQDYKIEYRLSLGDGNFYDPSTNTILSSGTSNYDKFTNAQIEDGNPSKIAIPAGFTGTVQVRAKASENLSASDIVSLAISRRATSTLGNITFDNSIFGFKSSLNANTALQYRVAVASGIPQNNWNNITAGTMPKFTNATDVTGKTFEFRLPPTSNAHASAILSLEGDKDFGIIAPDTYSLDPYTINFDTEKLTAVAETEYRVNIGNNNGTWTTVSGESVISLTDYVNGLTDGTKTSVEIEYRMPAAGGKPPSNAIKIELKGRPDAPTSIGIDYEDEEFTHADLANFIYRVGAKTATPVTNIPGGKISNDMFGEDVYISLKSAPPQITDWNGGTHTIAGDVQKLYDGNFESQSFEISVPARPASPTSMLSTTSTTEQLVLAGGNIKYLWTGGAETEYDEPIDLSEKGNDAEVTFYIPAVAGTSFKSEEVKYKVERAAFVGNIGFNYGNFAFDFTDPNLTVSPTALEYRITPNSGDPGSWKAWVANTIDGDSTKYYGVLLGGVGNSVGIEFRVAPTTSSLASQPSASKQIDFKAQNAPLQHPSIDYVTEKITFPVGLEYRLGSSGSFAQVTGSAAVIDLNDTIPSSSDNYFDKTFEYRDYGTESQVPSEIGEVTITPRPIMPTVTFDVEDIELTIASGSVNALEFKIIDNAPPQQIPLHDWTDYNAPAFKTAIESYIVENDASYRNQVQVRIKAVTTAQTEAFSSNIQTLPIPAKAAPPIKGIGFGVNYENETFTSTNTNLEYVVAKMADFTGPNVITEDDDVLTFVNTQIYIPVVTSGDTLDAQKNAFEIPENDEYYVIVFRTKAGNGSVASNPVIERVQRDTAPTASDTKDNDKDVWFDIATPAFGIGTSSKDIQYRVAAVDNTPVSQANPWKTLDTNTIEDDGVHSLLGSSTGNVRYEFRIAPTANTLGSRIATLTINKFEYATVAFNNVATINYSEETVKFVPPTTPNDYTGATIYYKINGGSELTATSEDSIDLTSAINATPAGGTFKIEVRLSGVGANPPTKVASGDIKGRANAPANIAYDYETFEFGAFTANEVEYRKMQHGKLVSIDNGVTEAEVWIPIENGATKLYVETPPMGVAVSYQFRTKAGSDIFASTMIMPELKSKTAPDSTTSAFEIDYTEINAADPNTAELTVKAGYEYIIATNAPDESITIAASVTSVSGGNSNFYVDLGDTVHIRKSAVAGTPVSEWFTLTVKERATAPTGVSVDFSKSSTDGSEIVSDIIVNGVTEFMEYAIYDGSNTVTSGDWTEIKSVDIDDNAIKIGGLEDGGSIYVRIAATASDPASQNFETTAITVPNKPTDPAEHGTNKGVVINLLNTMEYSLNGLVWKTFDGSGDLDLSWAVEASDKLKVRIKATDSTPPSAVEEVTFTGPTAPSL